MKTRSLRIGDTVRVRGYRQVTTIASRYDDIKGGVRLADAIGGFVSWNVADLVRVDLQAEILAKIRKR